MMSRMHGTLAIVLLSAVASVVLGAPDADRVTGLPNMTQPLPSQHYSGYLTALNGSYLHYYLVEAAEVQPSMAPLVLWMNGGPGCSSMDGWGYELGPFHFKGYNSSGPIFELNPFTYARIANVMFLEAPPGVGFSYREDGDYSITDTQNAENNLQAVLSFFDKFPEFRKNKFYVAGESYGGIYVPTLVQQILAYNEAGTTPDSATINLAGMIVGNGVTDADYDSNILTSDLPFAFGHGLISKELHDDTRDACIANPNGAACNHQQELFWDLTQYNNIYGVYYKCFSLPRESWKYVPRLRRRLEHLARKYFGGDVDKAIAAGAEIPPSPSGGDVPCIDSRVMEEYLNREDVKLALHVETSLTFHICYNINYTSNVQSVVSVYKSLLKFNIPTLVYNGDIDMAVPYTGTEGWLRTIDLTVTTPFKTWRFADPLYTFGEQLGGYATGYDDAAGGNHSGLWPKANSLWFVRVLGAGHMVPQFRPAAAFDMFSRFISGSGF